MASRSALHGELSQAVASLDDLAIGVSAHAERLPLDEKVDDLGRPGAVRRVADDDDLVDVLPLDRDEDRFERGEIAVDVAYRRDAHGATLPRDPEPRAGADEVECRTGPSTRLTRRRDGNPPL